MTRLKDIPALARDGKNLNAVIEAVRETLQTYRGYRGDDLDRALTPRDFAPGVLGGLTSGGGGGGTIFVIASGGGGGGADPTPDPTRPPTATGLAVSAGISHIYVSCDVQTYTQGHGHGVTVVYGAKWPSGAAPTFSSAVELFEFQGIFSAYPSDPATRWCIWIKWKSLDGYLSVDPAGGTNGGQATTGQDVALLRTALAGQIRESELYSTLGTRIDLIDAADTVAGSVAARVKAERDARITEVGDAISTAATYTETYAYENSLGEQVALDLLDLASVVTDPSTGLAATRATLTSDYATIAGATNSLASVTTALQAYADLAESDAVSSAQSYTNGYAYADADGTALAGTVSTISTAVNSPTILNNPTYATVQTEISTRTSLTDGLLAQWVVKLDVNGYVSGFGLASTSGTATPTSKFIVRTDTFAIASPTGPGITPAEPFIVQTTPTTINGVSIPAGVYMDAAFIYDLTASIARLGTAWIDNAMVASLSASKLTIGDGTVGGNLKSTSYSGGSGGTPGAGWLLQPGGNAYFNNAIIYGTIYASAGVFAGALSAATGTFAGALSAATGSFAGDISAATGTFSGSLNVNSGGSDRMEITATRIKIFNGGVERVRLGNLA